MPFDPVKFLQTEVQGKMETKYPSVPAGTYRAMVDNLKGRSQKNDDGSDPTPILDIYWTIDDAALKEKLGMEKISVRQSCFLDLSPEGAILRGEGKNIALGKVREAIGQNWEDKPWAPHMLKGAVASITVTNAPNPKDPESPYSNVQSVSKL